MTTPAFAPFQDLARTLLPHAFDKDNGDGSHDTSHLQRVWKNAAAIRPVSRQRPAHVWPPFGTRG
ncbi:hypothetical protein [Paraburkholderia fynbosensis]|uniref:Uncharacterized protein n=1 Tax=Paraburkholderia fynbosensis TaxID=1200993 RepID=A0A6J5G198_9BURK|nr:hypothetical protein LMG27177_02321 [Paraburkholderia fynbosensis]